jgi:hypothetical protein
MIFTDIPAQTNSSLQRNRFRWLLLICCAITGTSLVGYGSFTPRSRVVPIVDVKLGDNVVAQHPQGVVDRSLGDVVDPANWRQIDLQLEKEDGTPAKIQWLRPLRWFRETFGTDEHATEVELVGRSLTIDIPEFGLVGTAHVTGILPCPPIQTGTGCPVVGRFKHISQDVLILHISGEPNALGTTTSHPFWSETRQQFVAAGELKVGESLRTLRGVKTVERATPLPGRHTVYNLEVFGEHVYSVGAFGALVHNNNSGNKATDNAAHNAANFARYKAELARLEALSPGDPMRGTVMLRRPVAGSTAAQDAQIRESMSFSNLSELEGYMSPTGRVSTEGALRSVADRAASAERARAVASGSPYRWVVGHGPDTTWTGRPNAPFWVDLERSINSSLGRQAQGFPIGYRPSRFIFEGDY